MYSYTYLSETFINVQVAPKKNSIKDYCITD